jgi:PST family polysaccharide transporter
MPADRHLTRHVAVFSTAHAIGIIAPLITTPYLARVLGPDGWGPVLLAQGVAAFVALLPEFGFDLSGTRDLATTTDPAAQARIIADVRSARWVLVPVTALLVLGIALVLPMIGANRLLLVWTFAAVIARGFSPLWIFQGIGRPEGAMLIDVVGKIGAAVAVFALVDGVEDGWRVLALQSAGAALSVSILSWQIRRRYQVPPVSVAGARRALARGWAIFSFRAASAVYMQANVLIVGALASPVALVMFGGAERITRAGINLLAPITQAIFPRVARAVSDGPTASRRALREAMWIIGTIGLTLTLVLLLGARPLIAVLLGDGYGDAVPLLRGLAALPALIAIGTVLGIHWAIPQGHERYLLRNVLVAGAISVVCAMLLIPRLEAWGMVIGATAAEAWVAGALLLRFRRQAEGAA